MIIGIDPGKGGGVASIASDKSIKIFNCPETIKEMVEILRSCRNYAWIENEPLLTFIEWVHAFPTDGRKGSFTFGTNYGIWLGIIESLGIPYKKVSPQKWMASYQPLPKEKKLRKAKLKELAQEWHPKATLKTSDAILIAVWGNNE